ncbi:NYN domain-containing protein [Sandarakinorhabdus sp.]|uniref:NYN domain-containing protein n=1 Tax=Sandarakinorhabdus sp. TaxID=1916663 RepID=UPI00286E007F|nr:NYN domain-containing protein [Sandarakinorhabdus sp.]
MNSNGGALRLAVLIDGENVPAKDAGPLFAQVAKLGNPIIRRVYGDFTKGNVKDWPKVISQHGGSAHQNGHTSAGKNASDIALVVDAMDFLHKRSVDGFCIVTADGDFTSLAKRAREDGFKVFCFAHSHAAKALKAACDGFFPLVATAPTPAAPKTPVNTPAKLKATQPTPVRQPKLALSWLQDALPAETQWITFSALGIALRSKEPAYLKKTGYASLKKLLTALKDLYEQGVAADGKTEQVRRRS